MSKTRAYKLTMQCYRCGWAKTEAVNACSVCASNLFTPPMTPIQTTEYSRSEEPRIAVLYSEYHRLLTERHRMLVNSDCGRETKIKVEFQ